jgi:hypothetical protein
MTRPEVCKLPSSDLVTRRFNPVSWWLEAHPGRVSESIHSLKLIFDGHEITLRSNSPRVIDYLARHVAAYLPPPESGACRSGGLIEIHVIDEKQSRKIALPWGTGEQESYAVEFPSPLAAISSHKFLHFRWEGVEAFWRPFNLLASLEFSANTRIQLLVAGISHHTGAGTLRTLQVNVTEVEGGACFAQGNFVDKLSLEEIADLVRNMVVRAHGHFCLHAATVNLMSRGALLMGPSGSGKTTTALALMRGGFQMLSDEYSLLDASRDQMRVAGFRSRPRVMGQAPVRLAQLEETLNSGPGCKTEMDLRDLSAQRNDICWVSPAAMFFLQVQPGQQEHRINQIPVEEAFVRVTSQILDPTNVFRKEDQAKATIKLVEHCPAYELRLGRNLAALPDLVRSVIGGQA